MVLAHRYVQRAQLLRQHRVAAAADTVAAATAAAAAAQEALMEKGQPCVVRWRRCRCGGSGGGGGRRRGDGAPRSLRDGVLEEVQVGVCDAPARCLQDRRCVDSSLHPLKAVSPFSLHGERPGPPEPLGRLLLN